jgi:hypothetical protein
VAPFDDGDAAAELGSLNRRLLAGRSGSDHEQVEIALHRRVIGRGAGRFSWGARRPG